MWKDWLLILGKLKNTVFTFNLLQVQKVQFQNGRGYLIKDECATY
jgi:hypothetical protein